LADGHLAAQIVIAEGSGVQMLTQADKAKAKALELAVEVEVCATSVGGSSGASPEPLDAAIMVAPAAAGFHQLARMQRDDGSTAEPLTTLTR
jgi:3-oxoacyl-(acyl-carrier-protein) synthase